MLWQMQSALFSVRCFSLDVAGLSPSTSLVINKKCFRTLRQSTTFGRILHIFDMKVDMDLEVDSRSAPVARTAVVNTPDKLGKLHLCEPVDLWSSRMCATSFTREMSPWNASPWKLDVDVPESVLEVVNVAQKTREHLAACLCALCMSTLLQGSVTRKFMDVCDDKVTGEAGSVPQHDDHSKNTVALLKYVPDQSCGERDWVSAFHPDTSASLHG